MKHPHSNLKPHRKRSGFTQEELAFLLGGRKHSTISRYEGGERRPDLRTAFAYQLLFGHDLHELFPGIHAEVLGEISERAERLSEEIGRQGESAKSKYKLAKLARLQKEAVEDVRTV